MRKRFATTLEEKCLKYIRQKALDEDKDINDVLEEMIEKEMATLNSTNMKIAQRQFAVIGSSVGAYGVSEVSALTAIRKDS